MYMNNFFQQFFQNTIDLATFYTTNKKEPITLDAGIYDSAALKAAGISNNSIYRVDVPSGFIITLYSEDSFSGDILQLTSSSSSLGKLDKAISSLIIRDPSEDEEDTVTSSVPNTEEGTVTEEETVSESEPVTEDETDTEEDDTDYDDSDLKAIIYSRDSTISLGVGEYDAEAINELGIMNDGIYKIDVPNGLKVTLFSEDNFSGNSYFVTSNTMVDLIDSTYSIVVENNIMIPPTPSTESTPAPYKGKSTSKLPHLNFPGNFNYSNEISLSQTSVRVPKPVQAPIPVQRNPTPVQASIPVQINPTPVQAPIPVQRNPTPVQAPISVQAPTPVQAPIPVLIPKQVQRNPIPVQIEPEEEEEEEEVEVEVEEEEEIFPSVVPLYKEFDAIIKSNFGGNLIEDVSNTNLLIIILVFILLAIFIR